jgi:hypothetical protein
MPMLTPSSVHVDAPLTNLTIAYLQDQNNFIADKVFPNVAVAKKTDKYYIYDRENFNRVDVQARAPRTKAPRVGLTVSTDTYSTDVYSLSTDFDFETLANEDAALNICLSTVRKNGQPLSSVQASGVLTTLVLLLALARFSSSSGRITLTLHQSQTSQLLVVQ